MASSVEKTSYWFSFSDVCVHFFWQTISACLSDSFNTCNLWRHLVKQCNGKCCNPGTCAGDTGGSQSWDQPVPPRESKAGRSHTAESLVLGRKKIAISTRNSGEVETGLQAVRVTRQPSETPPQKLRCLLGMRCPPFLYTQKVNIGVSCFLFLCTRFQECKRLGSSTVNEGLKRSGSDGRRVTGWRISARQFGVIRQNPQCGFCPSRPTLRNSAGKVIEQAGVRALRRFPRYPGSC